VKTKEEVEKIVSDALKKVMDSAFYEAALGSSPRFVFKHMLRLQGLYLEDNNEITNMNGRPYATLGTVVWKDQDTLEATIRLYQDIKFIPISFDLKGL